MTIETCSAVPESEYLLMPRILIVDDHGVYRRGFRAALQMILPGSHIIEADNLQSARKDFDPDGNLDLAVADVDAPDAPLDSLCSLHEDFPKTRIVAISAGTDRGLILSCLEIGLFGFISKSQSDEELFSAIKDIISGRIYVPATLSHCNRSNRNGHPLDSRTASPAVFPDIQPDKLTPRQREILPLLAKGMSNKEIARALKIAEGTTKIHASCLLRVLGVRNRTEAAVVARDYFLSSATETSQNVQLVRRVASRRR